MSKESNILELFYNEPTKHWHFEDILKHAGISRPQAVQWIRKMLRDKLVKRIKPRKKMPYYVGNYAHPNYQARKRLHALASLVHCGLFSYLLGNPSIKLAILFGSYSRWDWYRESDVDLFVVGTGEARLPHFVLGREVELFYCSSKKGFSGYPPALLQNIREGFCIKGSFSMLDEKITR